MQSPQSIPNEEYRNGHDTKGGFGHDLSTRIVGKTFENIATFASELPAQIKKSPMTAVGVGVGIVGIAVAASVAPLLFKPKRTYGLDWLLSKKNMKALKKQMRSYGF